jgi:hypothetical protein
MSRINRQCRLGVKARVEVLESRLMLSHARTAMHPTVVHGAGREITPRPDLDAMASWLVAHPGRAARMGLGDLSKDLIKHAAAIKVHGSGTVMAMELAAHPIYTAVHHLSAYLTPPTPPAPTHVPAPSPTPVTTPTQTQPTPVGSKPAPSDPSPAQPTQPPI